MWCWWHNIPYSYQNQNQNQKGMCLKKSNKPHDFQIKYNVNNLEILGIEVSSNRSFKPAAQIMVDNA